MLLPRTTYLNPSSGGSNIIATLDGRCQLHLHIAISSSSILAFFCRFIISARQENPPWGMTFLTLLFVVFLPSFSFLPSIHFHLTRSLPVPVQILNRNYTESSPAQTYPPLFPASTIGQCLHLACRRSASAATTNIPHLLSRR